MPAPTIEYAEFAELGTTLGSFGYGMAKSGDLLKVHEDTEIPRTYLENAASFLGKRAPEKVSDADRNKIWNAIKAELRRIRAIKNSHKFLGTAQTASENMTPEDNAALAESATEQMSDEGKQKLLDKLMAELG